jgi:hypothetical protein
MKKYCIIFLLICGSYRLSAQGGMIRNYGFSVAMSNAFSFFQTDTRHASEAKMRFGMGGMFRFHFRPAPAVQIQLGLEILSQSCKFNTYYFETGYSQFYDRNFRFEHQLRIWEMYIPIIGRVNLSGSGEMAPASFYLLGGYAPKFFLQASTEITDRETGKGVWGGGTDLRFENWFINEQLGNVLIAGMGIDKRVRFTEKFVSFELIYRYNLSRFIYVGRYNTNELLIKNSVLTFQMGYRF